MTVYSRAIGREEFGGMGFSGSRANRRVSVEPKSQQTATAVAPVFKLNLILLFAASFMLVSYIFLSNFLTSQQYAANLSKAEFNQLSAASAAAEQELSDNQSLNGLMQFAQKSGMVEAKDTGVILEDGNFALSH